MVPTKIGIITRTKPNPSDNIYILLFFATFIFNAISLQLKQKKHRYVLNSTISTLFHLNKLSSLMHSLSQEEISRMHAIIWSRLF